MMWGSAYRSLDPVLRERVAALSDGRALEWFDARPLRQVLARRIARVVGGAVGALFGGASLVAGLAGYRDPPGSSWPTFLLLAGWPAALLAGAIARSAFAAFSWTPPTPFEHSDDAAADLVRLEESAPLRRALRLAARCESASVAMPLVAISLLAPLTVHFVVATAVMAMTAPSPLFWPVPAFNFASWIALSALIVGHAHIALAAYSVWWSRTLRLVPTARLGQQVHRSWGGALALATAVAAVPGVVLLGVPPILTALTGLVFIPPMYIVSARRLASERRVLEAAV